MVRPYLPLNALRAFEASARHLSFTRAAIELCVTQAAVSHQVKLLEERLGASLFHRLPRGLALTDEGRALRPTLEEAFDRIGWLLDQFEGGRFREVLTVGAVGTFAVGWLLPRLTRFREAHPFVDLRLSTNNNRVDIAAEGLDYAIRFGDGAWHGTDAVRLFDAPLSVLCAPEIARRLRDPADVGRETLLRSYRSDEWPGWFAAGGGAVGHAPGQGAGLRFLLPDGGGGDPGGRGGAGPGVDVPPAVGARPDRAALRRHRVQGRLLADLAEVATGDADHACLPRLAVRHGRGRQHRRSGQDRVTRRGACCRFSRCCQKRRRIRGAMNQAMGAARTMLTITTVGISVIACSEKLGTASTRTVPMPKTTPWIMP
nr:LysR family transcriptional regulator [Azospirillum lipoferum]